MDREVANSGESSHTTFEVQLSNEDVTNLHQGAPEGSSTGALLGEAVKDYLAWRRQVQTLTGEPLKLTNLASKLRRGHLNEILFSAIPGPHRNMNADNAARALLRDLEIKDPDSDDSAVERS